MPDLLGRELNAQEQGVVAEVEKLLARSGTARDLSASFQELLAKTPDTVCAALLFLLGTRHDPARRQIYYAAADHRSFWVALLRESRLSPTRLLEVCRHLMTIENLLDVRLARLTPGRDPDGDAPLDSETVLQILEVLDKLSTGPRLILLLNHLTLHPDRRIAAKATLLVGRRLRNQDWVERRLVSTDGRVRANAVEGLWGVRSLAARKSLWTSLRDKNNRVVGNALIGLHQLGEPAVHEFVTRMIQDPRPAFRWTAAWVMGKIGSEEFLPDLQRARKDKEPHVQRAAERAIEAILRPPAEEVPAPEPAGDASKDDRQDSSLPQPAARYVG